MDNNTNITNGFLIIYVNHHYNKFILSLSINNNFIFQL